MIRFLERNGYDVSYISGVDTDRSGALLDATTRRSCPSATTSTGPATSARTSRRPATPASTSMFFTGNEVYWKTRCGAQRRRLATRAYRTLVCYKETWDNAKIDPSPEWTGTWRDPRFAPPTEAEAVPRTA